MSKKPIAKTNGYAVYEEGTTLYFVNYKTFWLHQLSNCFKIILYVAGIASIPWFLSDPVLAIILLGTATLGYVFNKLLSSLIKKLQEKPLKELKITLIIDLKEKTLLNNDKTKLANLDEVTFKSNWLTGTLNAEWRYNKKLIAICYQISGGMPVLTQVLKKYDLKIVS